MRIALIGSNGLLASSIGKYCEDIHCELFVYGRKEPVSYKFVKFTCIDLLQEKLDYNELAESDIIIYTAGSGIQSNLKESNDIIYFLNVMSPVQIYNGMNEKDYKGHIISFGSYFEIGENIEDNPFSENDILQTNFKAPSNYVISKRMISRFVSSLSNVSFKFLHFILPTIYNENESNNRLIPYIIKSILENKSISLTSGDQVRQYIYSEDVVKVIFEAIAKNINSGVYNMKFVEEFTVKTLVENIFKHFNIDVNSEIFGTADRIDTGMKILRLNFDKLEHEISYKPMMKVADICPRYVHYYKNNENRK